ncbi:MAG: hypothetical protein U9Q73_00430 [Nanoarchaeota archaeon]|nr:hypothetical protein [Nanoarchaeota archaeon]
MINPITFIKNWWRGPQPPREYPRDFAIIDFSKIAFRLGIKDDKNKVILRYSVNNFGNLELKKHRYSEERKHVLSQIHKIPFFDKTKQAVRFPVYSKIMPGEATFTISK